MSGPAGAGVPAQQPLRKRFLIVLGGLTALAPLSIDMYLPGLPQIARGLGGTDAQVQLTLTTCLAGLALGQLFAGPLSDALGRRRPLLVGLAAYAAVSLLCALAPSVYAMAVLRFVQGLAGAAGIVIARAVVRDRYSGAAMARLFSVLMAVTGLAPILAPVLGSQVMLFTSWRGVFAVLAATGVLLLLLVFVGMPETLPAERRRGGGPRETLRTFRKLAADRAFFGYALAGGMSFGAMFAYISGSPFVLQNVYGASPQAFGALFGAIALGMVALSQVNGLLVGRFGPSRMLDVGLTAHVTGVLALLAVVAFADPGLVAVLVPLFLAVGSVGVIMANATALALADQGEVAGSASALLGAMQFVVGAISSPLVGLGGSGSALPMAAVMAALGIGAVLARRLLVPRAGE